MSSTSITHRSGDGGLVDHPYNTTDMVLAEDFGVVDSLVPRKDRLVLFRHHRKSILGGAVANDEIQTQQAFSWRRADKHMEVISASPGSYRDRSPSSDYPNHDKSRSTNGKYCKVSSKSKLNRHGSDREGRTPRESSHGRDIGHSGGYGRKRSRYNVSMSSPGRSDWDDGRRNSNITLVAASPWDIISPPLAVIRASGPSVRSSSSKHSGNSNHINSSLDKLPLAEGGNSGPGNKYKDLNHEISESTRSEIYPTAEQSL